MKAKPAPIRRVYVRIERVKPYQIRKPKPPRDPPFTFAKKQRARMEELDNQVVMWRCEEGLTFKQIGDRLGVTDSMARYRFFRGLRHLGIPWDLQSAMARRGWSRGE